MINRISSSIVFFICATITYLFISYRDWTVTYPISFTQNRNESTKILHSYNDTKGWISSSLYNELKSYIEARNNNSHYSKKTFIIHNGRIANLPLNYDYINLIKDDHEITYPYSSWKCSRSSNTDFQEGSEYCILTNIYYQSSTDQYFFFRNPSKTNIEMQRDTFMTSYGIFNLYLTDNITMIKSLHLSAILTRPLLITHPPDHNYAHGFLESCGPRFWVLAECQSHPSYINPAKIQIYYTSKLLDEFPSNWNNYLRQSDGTYLPRRRWEQMIQSMFSIYPLLTYKSFNHKTVMFQNIFTRFESGNLNEDPDDDTGSGNESDEYEYDLRKSDELDRYFSLRFDKDKKTIEALRFWKDQQHQFPFLSECARSILSIPATTTNVEREFSVVG
ncbi:unnamed protein product [Rotaria sordida]|uniref:HAT C-terminal dimerisation domain-containing protein n=1 Tax=Rotaria sordida TaxID=392033 RepID=A0A814HG49_9BILA|nr:unnamed protein product [Rotaria sordida]